MKSPRLLVRISKGLKRLDPRRRVLPWQVPADRAWREMLERLDADEAERRLSAVEQALNDPSSH